MRPRSVKARWIALVLLGATIPACSSDLFHRTDWPTRCDVAPAAEECRDGGATTSTSTGAGGAGGGATATATTTTTTTTTTTGSGGGGGGAGGAPADAGM